MTNSAAAGVRSHAGKRQHRIVGIAVAGCAGVDRSDTQQGKLIDLIEGDVVGQISGFGFQQRSFRRDVHGLRGGANLQGDILPEYLGRLHDEVRMAVGLEPSDRHCDVVGADGQIPDRIIAGAGGCRPVNDSGVRVGGFHHRSSDDSARRIGNRPCDGSVAHLAERQ